jgi:hypothetical protein
MKTELLQHIEEHKASFEAWVGVNARLQKSDVITPLIEAYESENNTTEVSKGTCQDCIIDMLRWALKKLKESKEVKTETKPKK